MNKVKDFLQKIRDVFASPSHSRTLIILGILLLALAVPVTVIFLSQRTVTQQNARVICGDNSSGVETGCGQTGGCTNSYSKTTTVVYDYSLTCQKVSCTSKGEVHGSCGVAACKNYTTPGVCHGQQLCDAVGNTCSTYVTYTNCSTIGGKCGAPTCDSKGGTCAYSCSNGNNPGGGYCSSTSMQCCKPAPKVTQPPTCGGSPTSSTGGCEKYQCNTGEVTMAATCSNGPEFVCCKKGTPSYKCINSSSFQGTDGSVTYCDSTQTCDSSKNGTTTDKGPSDAKTKMCVQAGFVCDSNLGTTPNNGFKNKATGEHKYCASDEYCTNAKTTGYPCAKIPTWYCQTHNGASLCDAKAIAGAYCDFTSASQKPSCKSGFVVSPVTSGNNYKYGCYDASGNPNYNVYACLPLQYNDQCSSFGGSCKLRSAGCYQGATLPYDCGDSFLTCCQSGQDAGACTSNSQCSSGQVCGVNGKCTTNDCEKNSGTCKSGSSQGAPSCDRSGNIAQYDSSCQNIFGSSSFCCKGSTTVTQPPCDSSKTNCNGSGSGNNPSPTPACTNGKTSQFALNLKLDGIGTGTFENNNPVATRSALYVKVTDQSSTTLYNNTTTVFNYSHGTFNGPTVSLGTSLSCGHTYTATVKIPRYLPAKGTVTYGTSNVIAISPIAGDINKVSLTTQAIVGDDKVDVNDYALVRACHNADPNTPKTFTDNTTSVTVTCAQLMNFIDYPDGGTQGDEWSFNYNVWVRGYFKANGY